MKVCLKFIQASFQILAQLLVSPRGAYGFGDPNPMAPVPKVLPSEPGLLVNNQSRARAVEGAVKSL